MHTLKLPRLSRDINKYLKLLTEVKENKLDKNKFKKVSGVSESYLIFILRISKHSTLSAVATHL